MVNLRKRKQLINRNQRNNLVNYFYTKKIKEIIKSFKNSLNNILKENNLSQLNKAIINPVYSIFDKAANKGIIHKNTASRKKTKFLNLFKKTIYKFNS